MTKLHFFTSSGNHTPGCVLPSRIAIANAAVAVPTDLKDMKEYSPSKVENQKGIVNI